MNNANPFAQSVRVYSRTVLDDGRTWSRYEYNGSFHYAADLDIMTEQEMEGYAKCFDCFYQVLFVRDGAYALPYTMQDYR